MPRRQSGYFRVNRRIPRYGRLSRHHVMPHYLQMVKLFDIAIIISSTSPQVQASGYFERTNMPSIFGHCERADFIIAFLGAAMTPKFHDFERHTCMYIAPSFGLIITYWCRCTAYSHIMALTIYGHMIDIIIKNNTPRIGHKFHNIESANTTNYFTKASRIDRYYLIRLILQRLLIIYTRCTHATQNRRK